MDETNSTEVVTLLKSLTERFDNLQKDVETLKEEARRSASDSLSETEPPRSESTRRKKGRTRRSTSDSPSEAEPSNEETRSRRRAKCSRNSRSRTYAEATKNRSPSSSCSPSRHRADRERDRATRRARVAPKEGPRVKSKQWRSRSPHRPTRSWADRMSDTEEEEIDYNEAVVFSSDEEDQPNSKLVEVLERTKAFLQEKCTRRVPNGERMHIRNRYPLPKVPATRTPQLDSVMKQEASSVIKSSDKQLAKVQTLLLDSLAPLTALVEAHHKGEQLDSVETLRAVKASVQLIGNANAHMSHLRRVRVIGDINKALLPIVGEDQNFREAPPLLFGTDFAKKGHPQNKGRTQT